MNLNKSNLMTRTWADGSTGWHGTQMLHIPSGLVSTMEGMIDDTSMATLNSKARKLLERKVEVWQIQQKLAEAGTETAAPIVEEMAT
jgi:hypothetical protein